MDDYLVRVLAREAGVRGFACLTTKLVVEAARRHQTPPAATIALGEALTGAVLLGTLLKVGHRAALKIEGNKSGRKILVEANNNGKVRGYVSIPEDDPILSGPGLFDDLFIEQDGQLTVVKDLRLKNLYESVVALTGEGLVADFDSYLNKSEQIPSVVEAGVILSETEPGVGKVVAAGGLLLQALPPYEPEPIIKLRDLVQEMPPIEVILNNGQTPETILAALFNEFEYEILEVIPLAFRCSCSWERSEKALISLGREELVNLLETEGQAVVDCHFCHERYLFDADDLKQLIDMFDDPA
jgi:molecular chaperone Hsp33